MLHDSRIGITDLYDILGKTNNNNTIPTNHPDVSEWGTYYHFFERIEFQNNGVAHIYGIYWTTKSIEKMINNNNIIRSDIPDPNLELELGLANYINKYIAKPELSHLFNFQEDPLSICSKTIMFISLIDFNDDDPNWNDYIEKYFARPINEIFNNMTIENIMKYNICSTFNGSSKRDIYTDN
ncbi:hypothetical protein RCL_jg7076.t1 [Rhizophagus clarus]|uniref:Uncharacterized protein n=1 Tax=Rhizophagus clarus TaxID=94130 RepID=A0A8H3M3J2_9GLOM|nr:hypothetical protein RCL_jg7076.t1 [Rhizophagus clarus]